MVSIGVWQYIIHPALLPRTHPCPVQLPTVVNLRFKMQRTQRSGHLNSFFIELILIYCFIVFVKCFYKYMVHELVR